LDLIEPPLDPASYEEGVMGEPTLIPRRPTDLGTAWPTNMLPVVFDGCFGWLHRTLDGQAARVAVLLCPGLKTDGVTGYRSFRLLANALAAAGYPTLRFSYPGTGDSCDRDGVEHLAAWQQSIHSAANWLRYHIGADQLVLCGLRFGATLATLVAGERVDAVGLILLAPIPRGRSYIRQLAVEAHNRPSPPRDEVGLVSHELHLSAETVQLISEIDLRRVVLTQGCQVAVFSETSSPVLVECSEIWRGRGTEVAYNDFAGLDAMLRPAFMSHEASVDVSRIVDWLRRRVPDQSAPLRTASIPDGAELRPAGCTETPLQFGEDRNLFGMLCRPAGPKEAELVVVMANSGGDPHFGGGRVSVNLARQLATEGITSLRIDFAGLGDSTAPGDAETHVFETDRRPDISAAVDALSALGYRRFAVQGLCSGAFHAFHAALADRRISVVLLVNLPLLQWRAGQPVELLSYKNTSQFLRRLGHIDRWWKLWLHGRLDLRARFVMLWAWLAGTAKTALRRLARQLGFTRCGSFAQASMNRLSKQARTLLLFAEGDEGFAAVVREFGQGVTSRVVSLQIVPGLDHSLTGRDMQHIVAERIIAFLTAELLDRHTSDEPVPAPPDESSAV
jgi:alpha/beta superfamily hydrolase